MVAGGEAGGQALSQREILNTRRSLSVQLVCVGENKFGHVRFCELAVMTRLSRVHDIMVT